jgi:protein-S-isoprenylcysteine O-methyltransferase Ste14
MEKLNFFGAGPKIGIVTIPWLALTILFTLKMKDTFYITEGGSPVLRTTGIIILVAGLLLYFITVRGLLKGLKETKLITSGGFFLCQNPLYASLILFILPGIALLMNSWLILTSSAVGYLMFRMIIKTEYKELEKVFGESYLKYKRETPEFFPFPLKKLFR